MLTTLGKDTYYQQVLDASNLVVNLGNDPEASPKLCALGVHYAYIGNKNYSPSSESNLRKFAENSKSTILYNKEGIIIIDICPQE